jgi:hypothetical protein
MRKILLTAAAASVLTALVMQSAAVLEKKMKLENPKVRISEIVYKPGEPRTPYVRPTDQVIVFLDDARYERKDSKTGAVEIRDRKSGDVIWHDKGEDAPQLTAIGKPYRTLLIEWK